MLMRLGAIQIGTCNRLRSSVADQFLSPAREFVALGMAAEIVVVVENQNARLVSHLLAIKIRRGQAADATAHDDQVERLFVFCGLVPLLPVPQGGSRFPRAVVAAAHASLCRWIIAGLLFWSILGLGRVEHFRKKLTRSS